MDEGRPTLLLEAVLDFWQLASVELMRTDVSIETGTKHIIVDTKSYRETLSEYRDTKKLHTEHLYPLFS